MSERSCDESPVVISGKNLLRLEAYGERDVTGQELAPKLHQIGLMARAAEFDAETDPAVIVLRGVPSMKLGQGRRSSHMRSLWRDHACCAPG
jgi:hypothetical protein